MLQLLQQRTRLSGRIGRIKHRHGAVVYVPERERELLARLTRLSKGHPPPHAVAALYREILSISRAAQAQAPIGLLQASAGVVLPASHAAFGACDRFLPMRRWRDLAGALRKGKLSLTLLTGDDLVAALQLPRNRSEFARRFAVIAELAPMRGSKPSAARRVFVVTPQPKEPASHADRLLILIECKSTLNAIKSLLRAMPTLSFHAETLTPRAAARRKTAPSLIWLALSEPFDGAEAAGRVTDAAKRAGLSIAVLGAYPGTENYGG